MPNEPLVIDIPPTDLSSHFATPEECETMRKKWRVDENYHCHKCGGPAYVERGGPDRWGCPANKFTTTSPSRYFSKKE